MKIYNLLLTVLICACVFVIATSAFPQNKILQMGLRQQLIGEWRNLSLRIKMNINDKTAQPMIVEADSSNWEAKLQIKPIRTHFKNDGSYYSEYRNLKDSIIRTASGTSAVKNDSITMVQDKPDKSTLKMHVSINNNRATFTGIIDFNGDGKLDDDYYGVQKKFSDKP